MNQFPTGEKVLGKIINTFDSDETSQIAKEANITVFLASQQLTKPLHLVLSSQQPLHHQTICETAR